MALAVDVEPGMRARADAGLFVRAPINEVVAALRARAGVIGNLVGRQTCARANFLRRVPERACMILIGHDQLAGGMQRRERCVLLDSERVEL